MYYLLYHSYHWSYCWPTPRFSAASAARKRGDKGDVITKYLKTAVGDIDPEADADTENPDLLMHVFQTLERYFPARDNKDHPKDQTVEDALKLISDSVWAIKLDLLQWMHMKRSERWHLLVDYARRVDEDTKRDASVSMIGHKAKFPSVAEHSGHWQQMPESVDLDSNFNGQDLQYVCPTHAGARAVVRVRNSKTYAQMDKEYLLENSKDWDDLMKMHKLHDEEGDDKSKKPAAVAVQQPRAKAANN